jgi:hypothetical protein
VFSIRGLFFSLSLIQHGNAKRKTPEPSFLNSTPPSISRFNTAHHLLPQRGGTALAEFGTLGLLFVDTGSEEFGVVVAIEIAG